MKNDLHHTVAGRPAKPAKPSGADEGPGAMQRTPGQTPHVFDRSGGAALSDFQSPQWRELFQLLEKEQSDFLAKESAFRSPEYLWPRDPLHTWSRVWEYPFTYRQFQTERARHLAGGPLHVVDVGSGVTFFPFSVARLGFHVTCTDIDPIAQKDLTKAAVSIPHAPGKVDFRLIEGEALPFADRELDAAYCVSVLEHIPTFAHTIAEIARILKPGGLFVLTFDLDLRGDSEIGADGYRLLKSVLADYFELRLPEKGVHPVDLLTSRAGPYPAHDASNQTGAWFRAKEAIKPIIGKRPAPKEVYYLAVEGLVLNRKPG